MVKRPWHPFEHMYKKGFAVGETDIREDAIFFRWWDECYVVPTLQACKIWTWAGPNIFAKRSAVRKLVKEGNAVRFYPKYVEE